MKKYNVFVYGTLLEKDNDFNNLLERMCDFSIDATYNGKMYSLMDKYPVVIPSLNSDDIVYGKIYELSNELVLDILDMYENYDPCDIDNFYIRKLVYVNDINQNECLAYIYIIDQNNLIKNTIINYIPSGNWLQYVNKILTQ